MRTQLAMAPRSRQAGVTLVEMMVASALGLLLALVVTGSVLTMGRQLSATGATSAAQASAQVALSLMDAAGRAAGAGFYNNGMPICPTWNAWNGTAKVADGAVFLPARIADGGAAGISDTVIFTGGTGTRTLVATPLMDNATGAAASLKVSNAGDWRDGDLAVIGAPGASVPCALLQVTGVPTVTSGCGGNATSCRLLVRNPNQGLNPSAANNFFADRPSYGFVTGTSPAVTGPAVVSRVGSTASGGLRQHAFAVQCGALVRYNAFLGAPAACTQNPLAFGAGVEALAADVVLMHAQYGISASAASDVVTGWVDAGGATWAAPSVANAGRIKAVRVVVVVRAREPSATEVSKACTNAAAVANTGPCSFQDAAAPVIDLSGIATAPGRTWRHYRYRVQRAVIPLHNVIWSTA